MLLRDIQELEVKVKEFFDVEVTDSEILVSDDESYWVLAIPDCEIEVKEILENDLGFENYQEVWITRGEQVEIPNNIIYKHRKEELKEKWEKLMKLSCDFSYKIHRHCGSKIFQDDREDILFALRWNKKICKTESDFRHFINKMNSFFRESVKIKGRNKECITGKIKGILTERCGFYRNLRNLRVGWAAHDPKKLDDPIKQAERARDSFKELSGKDPSEFKQIDWFWIQLKLIEKGIEDIRNLKNDDSFLNEIKGVING